MKQELDRIKGDVETMQKAMGLAPMAREWIHWLKRDQWIGLLWCLPGLVEIAGSLLPVDHKRKHWGLVADQWTGIFTAVALAAVAAYGCWKTMGRDGRPEAVARETKRMWGSGPEGKRFCFALVAQVVAFYLWGKQQHLSFDGFFTGVFVFMGCACLTGAVVAKIWQGMAFAIPFLIYGFCHPLLKNNYPADRVSLGIMFIAIALMVSFIHAWQIRQAEAQNESH